jgi:hypothetical protein
MYGSVKNPDMAFERLKPENKEVLLLIQLMLTEVLSNDLAVRF